MRGSSRPIAATAIPQAHELHFLQTARKRGIKQPEVASFIRIEPLRQRAKLCRHDPHGILELRLHLEETLAPFVATVRSQDGLCDEIRFRDRQEYLATPPTPLAFLEKQQVASRGGLRVCNVLRTGVELLESFCDLLCRDRLLLGRETR